MKKKYSTLLNFALATCVATTLVACSDGDYTGPAFKSDSYPSVNIGGTVLDTNGNPLKDVKVSCEGQQGITNSSGQYNIPNLRVHNVVGSREQTTNSYDNEEMAVTCVVEAPAGYLGARVFVWPEAQVLNTLYDNTSETSAQTNQPLIWVDGMYAEAATAWLPKLDSEVCGVLRFCGTGEPVRDAQLRLDMWAVNNNNTVEQADGGYDTNEVTYSTSMYSTTTDDVDGTFCISGVPDDSILRLYAPMYQDLSVSGNGYAEVDCSGSKPCTSEGAYISTVNEGLLTLGNVCVDAIPAGDSIQPCATGVDDWVHLGNGWQTISSDHTVPGLFQFGDGTVVWAVLPDDTDGTGEGFAVLFNEAMDPSKIDGNSVILWNEGPDTSDMTDDGYITDFTATIQGRALKIVTGEPLGDDDHVKIFLLRSDFTDLAGNYLISQDLFHNDVCVDNGWVEDFWSNNGTGYVVLGVKIFSPDSTNVGEVTDLTQICVGDGGADGFPALHAAYPNTFGDFASSISGFQNLNLDDDYWEERLEALAQAGGNNAIVDNGYGLVTFVTPSEGSYTVSQTTGLVTTNNICSGSNMGTTVSCVIPGAVANLTTVSVTSLDDFDNPSNVVTIGLEDCAAPTTVLNYAYNTCGHVGYNPGTYGLPDASLGGYDTNYAAHICTVGEVLGDPAYGDGGENTEEAEASILGLPTLNITCRLLKDADDAPSVSEPIDFFGLYGEIDTYPFAPSAVNNNELYDATAFADWQPFADTIGVAFSENIRMTDGGSIGWNGVTDITSWAVGNNITQQDDSEPIDANPYGGSVDLAQITVDDVITLANDDHGEVMNFSDAVEDMAGNAADNARVVVNDLLPPFVTSAFWDGDLVINFNEPVNVCTDVADGCSVTTVTLMDPTYGGNGAYGGFGDASLTTQGATLSVDGMTLTIPSATIAASSFDRAAHFPGVAITGALVYDEAAYDTILTTPLTTYNHGRLNFDNIEDMNGNSWEDWDGDTPGTAAAPVDFVGINAQALCNTPEFAPVDALGPFIITSIPLTQAPGDQVTRFNVVYTFSLPIDYGFSFAGCSGVNNTPTCANTWLQTGGNLAGVTTLNFTGATATTGSTYNDLTRTLNLVFEGSGYWVTGDTIEFSTGWRFISAFGGNSRTLNNHTIE